MYRILLAVDQSEERAEACARAVTELPGDPEELEVRILHSFTDNPEGASASQVEAVRVARDYLDEHGVPYEIDESSGHPADIVEQVADEMDANLIVLAGRKRSPAGKAIFGSVTQEVILNTSHNVLVAGPGAGR
ncbi:MAG: universal stress protein [Haloferacaceae archaeon]